MKPKLRRAFTPRAAAREGIIPRSEMLARRRNGQLKRTPDNPWQLWERLNVRRQEMGLRLLRAPKRLRLKYTPAMLVAIRAREVNFLGERQR